MQVPTRAVRYTVDGIEELISEETIHVDFGCEHTTPNVTVKALAQAIEQQAKRSGALLSDSWRLIISSNYQVEPLSSLPPPPSPFPYMLTPLPNPPSSSRPPGSSWPGPPGFNLWQVIQRPEHDLIPIQDDVPLVLILGHGGRISCKAIDLAKSAACIPMEVQVRTLAGKVTSVPIAPWHLVSDLKNTVHSLDGTEPARQRLIFDGQQLEDHELCSSYKINEGATLHLVWKLHGVPSSPTMGERFSLMDGIHPRPFCQITITPIMSKPMALMVPVGRQGLSMVLQAITCGGFLHFWQTSTQQAEGLPDMLRGWS